MRFLLYVNNPELDWPRVRDTDPQHGWLAGETLDALMLRKGHFCNSVSLPVYG